MNIKKIPFKIMIAAEQRSPCQGARYIQLEMGGAAYGPAYGVSYAQPVYGPSYSVDVMVVVIGTMGDTAGRWRLSRIHRSDLDVAPGEPSTLTGIFK
jgi:hypothetical protein